MNRAQRDRLAIIYRLKAAGLSSEGVVVLDDRELRVLKAALGLVDRPGAVQVPDLVDLNREQS